MIRVVAGVIIEDGRILICQRQAGRFGAHQWEFPGGKVEPGEEPQGCLRRELKEELGIDAVIGPELYRITHHYPDRSVDLAFYRVEAYEGRPVNREFRTLQWVERNRLGHFDFLEADRSFIRALEAGWLP